jgi:hypothetical protein
MYSYEICGSLGTTGDVQLQGYVVQLGLQVNYSYSSMWYNWDHSDVHLWGYVVPL